MNIIGPQCHPRQENGHIFCHIKRNIYIIFNRVVHGVSSVFHRFSMGFSMVFHCFPRVSHGFFHRLKRCQGAIDPTAPHPRSPPGTDPLTATSPSLGWHRGHRWGNLEISLVKRGENVVISLVKYGLRYGVKQGLDTAGSFPYGYFERNMMKPIDVY